MNYYDRLMDWGSEKIFACGVSAIFTLAGLYAGVDYIHDIFTRNNDGIVHLENVAIGETGVSFKFKGVSYDESRVLRKMTEDCSSRLNGNRNLSPYYEITENGSFVLRTHEMSILESLASVQDIVHKSGIEIH